MLCPVDLPGQSVNFQRRFLHTELQCSCFFSVCYYYYYYYWVVDNIGAWGSVVVKALRY